MEGSRYEEMILTIVRNVYCTYTGATRSLHGFGPIPAKSTSSISCFGKHGIRCYVN